MNPEQKRRAHNARVRANADAQLPICANCDDYVAPKGQILCHRCNIENERQIVEEANMQNA